MTKCKEVIERLESNENDALWGEIVEELCPFDVGDEVALNMGDRVERLERVTKLLEMKVYKLKKCPSLSVRMSVSVSGMSLRMSGMGWAAFADLVMYNHASAQTQLTLPWTKIISFLLMSEYCWHKLLFSNMCVF